MIWLIYALIALIALVLLINILGLALSPSHTVGCSLRLSASPQEVWDVVSDFANQGWRTELRGVEKLPNRDGHEVWSENLGKWSMPLVTEVSEPPLRMIRRLDEPRLPFRGIWTYDIEPDGAGTRLTVTERGEVLVPMLRALSRMQDLSKTVRTYLADLARRLGQDAVVERLPHAPRQKD